MNTRPVHRFPLKESIAADPVLSRNLAAAGLEDTGAHNPHPVLTAVKAETERDAQAPKD